MLNMNKSKLSLEMLLWGVGYFVFGVFFPIAAMITLILFDWTLLGWCIFPVWLIGVILSSILYFRKKSIAARIILIILLAVPILLAVFVLVGLSSGFFKI